MKDLLTIICCLFLVRGSAQIKATLSLKTASGYEKNIFKAPKTFLKNGILKHKNDLYRSSFFQEGGFRFLAKRPWKNQSVSFRFNPSGIYYFSENKYSYFTFLSGFRYKNQLNKNTKWQMNSWYRINNRDGINIDGSELNFPLGNKYFGFTSSIDFRLYKPNRSFIKLIYGNRDYKQSNGYDLSYNAVGTNAVIRNVFKKKAGWHSYGIEAGFITKFFDQKSLTTNYKNTFNWKDISGELFYRYPITKELDIKPCFEFKTRADSNQHKFSYKQLRPSVNLVYKNKKTNLSLTATYINRKYKNLEATNDNWTALGKLKYQYYQVKLVGEHAFNKKIMLSLYSFLNNRTSNKTNQNSIFFRAYDYYYVSLGLKYKL